MQIRYILSFIFGYEYSQTYSCIEFMCLASHASSHYYNYYKLITIISSFLYEPLNFTDKPIDTCISVMCNYCLYVIIETDDLQYQISDIRNINQSYSQPIQLSSYIACQGKKSSQYYMYIVFKKYLVFMMQLVSEQISTQPTSGHYH